MNEQMELDDGSVIGNYRVVRLLGQGGMGTVYEVEHLELGTHYALKTFTFDPENDASRALKTKFLEEGKLLARLKHPNLTHVFDLGFEEKTQMPYFVMDLVVYEDGETYTVEDIDLKDIDEDMVYGWFVQLASALDYIHGEGIVHRDIKPSNLLVDKDLNVVLTDFGISRIFGAKIRGEVEATRTMVSKTGRGKLVLGTEHYIAPEVAEGEEATPQADAYSLGVMLLRWLTGFYYGDNPGAIALLSKKKYRWLGVIAQLLAPVGRRPEKYAELVKLLKPNVVAKPKPPAGAKSRKAKKGTWLQAFLIAAVVLAFVCGAAWFGYQGWLRYDADKKVNAARLAEMQRQIAEQVKNAQVAEEEKVRAEKAAEARRLAEEKARQAAIAERERQARERTQIAKQDPAALAIPEVPQATMEREKQKEFVIVKDEQDEQVDYGPIPDKRYVWLKNSNAALPQEVNFQLANGAQIELVPRKAGSFLMSNEWDSGKRVHKVTLTRPFWMSKYYVTILQLRDFAPNDYEDAYQIAKKLNFKYPVSKRINRWTIDAYCAYLTKRYEKQLPAGYVFRLPSEAEWEYTQEVDATIGKYEQWGVKDWSDFVSGSGEVARETFKSICKEYGFGRDVWLLDDYWNPGWTKDTNIFVGGKQKPFASGVYDMMHRTWSWWWCNALLDAVSRGVKIEYADEEVDPLRWEDGLGVYDGSRIDILYHRAALGTMGSRGRRSANATYVFHIVLGPDLIGEKTWQTCKSVVDDVKLAKPIVQKYNWNPQKVPAKISKPKEVKFKLANGAEMIFCTIPKGRFQMSNIEGQQKQTHRVELTYPFWFSKYCVSTRQWREFGRFDDEKAKPIEKIFQKEGYPICMQRNYRQWVAYCRFLNERYSDTLPTGYVFRLPTETEWEYAVAANPKGDVFAVNSSVFDNWNGRYLSQFEKLLQKKRLPASVRLGKDGWSYYSYGNEYYVGGRLEANEWGVCDVIIGGSGHVVLDTYDVEGGTFNGIAEENGWGLPIRDMIYGDVEVDPFHSDGRVARRCVVRQSWTGRRLRQFWESNGFAHIVVGPDLEKAKMDAELAPYPEEDFGGRFLGDGAKIKDLSSSQMDWTVGQQRMLSRESTIARAIDKDEDVKGFHTRREDSPWVILELENKSQITGLQIERFKYEGQTQHLVVRTSEDGKRWREVAKDEQTRHRYRFDLQKKNVRAKYIWIGREPGFRKNDAFALDKVLIYGK